MVQQPRLHKEWQTFFFDIASLAPIPWLIVQGNHDIGPSQKYFHEQTFHAVTICGIRIIVLDTNRNTPDQLQWLEEELKSINYMQAEYKIVLMHVAPFIEFWEPKAWYSGESEWPEYAQQNFVPLLEEAKVDLVVSGHQHNYQRGKRNGVTFVVSGGAGGDLDLERVTDYKFYSVTKLEHHYLILSKRTNELVVRAYGLDNEVIDDFRIKNRKME